MSRVVMLASKRPYQTDSYVGPTLRASIEHYGERFEPDPEAKQGIVEELLSASIDELESCSYALSRIMLEFNLIIPEKVLIFINELSDCLRDAFFDQLQISDLAAYCEFLSSQSPEEFSLAIQPVPTLLPIEDLLCDFARCPECWESVSKKLFDLRIEVSIDLLFRLPFMPFCCYFEVLSDAICASGDSLAREQLADKIELDSVIQYHEVEALRIFACGALFSGLNQLKYCEKRCARWIRKCLKSTRQEVVNAAVEVIKEIAVVVPNLLENIGAIDIAMCRSRDELLMFCSPELEVEIEEIECNNIEE